MPMSWREKLINSRTEQGNNVDRYRALVKDLPTVVNMRGAIGNDLFISPVKSLGMFTQSFLRISSNGLTVPEIHPQSAVLDRSMWIGYRKPGIALGQEYEYERLSQREEPCLASAVCDWGGVDVIRYSLGDALSVDCPSIRFLPRGGATHAIRFGHKNPEIVRGVKEAGVVRNFVRTLVGTVGTGNIDPRDIEVFCSHMHLPRPVCDMHSHGTDAHTAGSDGGQCLVLSQEDVFDMDDELDEMGLDPVGLAPFRPNIILQGLPPGALDLADEIRISDGKGGWIRMLMGGLCDRCAVTTVDQTTGQRRRDGQPMQWLGEHRPARPDLPQSITMGVYAAFPSSEYGKLIQGGAEFQIVSEKK